MTATLILTCITLLTITATADATTVAQAKKEVRRLWGKQAPRAYCIIGRESGWNPRAVSATGDHGLFQLNAYTWERYFGRRWARRYDPVANVRMGYVIYKRAGGFSPWRGGRWAC